MSQVEVDHQSMPWSQLMLREIRKIYPQSIEIDNVFVIPRTHADTDWRVARLRQSIDEHDGQLGHSLNELCRQLELGITASHVSRLFRQAMGIGIREYMKRKRLQSAAIKLKTTTLSIKEIAADLGYRSPADFFRQFKRAFHVTPAAFRAASHTAAVDGGPRRTKIVS